MKGCCVRRVEGVLLSKDVEVVYQVQVCDSHHIYLIHRILLISVWFFTQHLLFAPLLVGGGLSPNRRFKERTSLLVLAQGGSLDGLLSQVNKQLLNYVSRGEPAPYKRKAKK